ncbi:MAG: hypothetical protein JWQ04_2688, partial [Pedosphaera sp.]|nr:hypothetical protein [Pedosphaera sp.]
MSLINDALKRAKATQPKVAAQADGPALRPIIAPRRANAGADFLLPALIVVILLLAGLLLWQWFRGGSGDTKVRARTIATPDVVQPAPASSANPQSAIRNPQFPIAAPEKTAPINVPAAPVASQVTTNTSTAIEPAAPAPVATPPPV